MDRQELRSKMPYGFQKVIAERAGVSQKSVSFWFNGRTKRYNGKIEMVVLQVAAEISEEKRKLIDKILW